MNKNSNSNINNADYCNIIINILLYFFIYSFWGWAFETIYMSVYHGHIVKRGFLIGPLCGIYGIGTISIIYMLNRIKSHPFMLFLCSSVISSILELLTGIIFKTFFNQRLWDYSNKFANFKGYICLPNTIIWGILALFLVYVAHPAVKKTVDLIPARVRKIIFSSALIFFSFDLYISIYTSLNGINNIVWLTQLYTNKLKELHNISLKVVYYFNH